MQFCSWFPCPKLIFLPRCPVHHVCSVSKRFVNAVEMQWSDTNLNADVSSSLVFESSQNQEERLDMFLIIRKYMYIKKKRDQNILSTGPKLICFSQLEVGKNFSIYICSVCLAFCFPFIFFICSFFFRITRCCSIFLQNSPVFCNFHAYLAFSLILSVVA